MAIHHYPSDDDQSFTSAKSDLDDHTFTPEEEAALLADSNNLKNSANTLFAKGSYGEAIQTYDRALASCPNYLDYDIAVLRSNIAACHLKLKDWKAAIESATGSLECLDRLDPPVKKSAVEANQASGGRRVEKLNGRTGDGASSVVEELDDETAERLEAASRALAKSGRSRADIQKIRVKVLLRRAKARTETGGWAALQGADEDYRDLTTLPLGPMDRKTVDTALRDLPPRLEDAKQKDVAEMMGKLKGLGNSLLKPFGLSTENFQFIKDEKTGGYSMNFNQGS
ncbi:hypothetical protein LTR66_008085 [Elasticomyces elasticus]|nr:hypothetical protein LTR66_008085 [Elasticomyces elasticus]